MRLRLGKRSYVLCALATLVVGALFWAVDSWRVRADWEQAQKEIAAGQHDRALGRLKRLVARSPRDGEVLYQLGICEIATGHADRALRAWELVPAQSPFFGRAGVLLGREALKRHQWSLAEAAFRRALGDRGPHAIEGRVTMIQLLKLEGRYGEARALVRSGWDDYPDPEGSLKELARLDTERPMKIEKLAPMVEEAYRHAPDDDRVWLGWANLSIQTGRLDVARKWLDACLERRPADPAVWRVRLDWARAAEDEDQVRSALAYLDGEMVAPNEALGLGAWLCRSEQKGARERGYLEELVSRDPAALWALERLAEILQVGGDSKRAHELRTTKAERERVLDWYLIHTFANDRLTHAAELARGAERLGRVFEASVWWQLAARQPDHRKEALAEIERLTLAQSSTRPPTGPTPAELLADLARPSKELRAAARPAGAAPRFVDDATVAGLNFRQDNGASPLRQVPETMSGGVGLLDYDGDGWLDVYAIQGGTFPPPATNQIPPPDKGDRLFHNKGDGSFEDVTVRSQIAALLQGYGHGVTVGDIDNDGHPDLFLTRWRGYALYRNRGDGTFEDVTNAWGLGGDRDWPTSAAFGDLDGDGDLDLYVCHYIAWDADHPPTCPSADRKSYAYCGPPEYPSMPDHLFRNNGNRFVDVTRAAGIADTDGRGLGVIIHDLDGDGRPDIFVANDGSAKFLFRNKGSFQFEEVGHDAGLACNAAGACQASMGLACGDYTGDGLPDLAVTNYYNEYTAIYANLGSGIFSDHSAAVGVAAPSRSRLGFGIGFLDFNNDGRLDLATANGHVEDLRPALPREMPGQLFAASADGAHFVDVTDRAGAAFERPLLGRGMAIGDLDNDGRMDLVIVAQNQNIAYFHNQTDGGPALTLSLEGRRSNRDAIGARVTVQSGGRLQTGFRSGGGSYQSASDPRLHFGLGNLGPIAVTVYWPSGQVDRYDGVKPNGGYRLREGDPEPAALRGYRARGDGKHVD